MPNEAIHLCGLNHTAARTNSASVTPGSNEKLIDSVRFSFPHAPCNCIATVRVCLRTTECSSRYTDVCQVFGGGGVGVSVTRTWLYCCLLLMANSLAILDDFPRLYNESEQLP